MIKRIKIITTEGREFEYLCEDQDVNKTIGERANHIGGSVRSVVVEECMQEHIDPSVITMEELSGGTYYEW